MHLIDESHYDCAIEERDCKTLHLVLSKALHGAAKTVLLWRNLLAETLAKNSFELDPYGLSAANAAAKEK